ncbi:MAG: hypothetical protein MUF22_02410 [Chitinispirillaceae bacterium]|jgi:Skp family chaperone for outer membrane proteins|nr:hypothetical protein [Chitinispirillaceae bacterium]
MTKARMIGMFLLAAVLVAGAGLTGCTKKPNSQELTKLEDARNAAESAEAKLAELRQERIKLEQELQSRQSELQAKEKERDELDQKVNK